MQQPPTNVLSGMREHGGAFSSYPNQVPSYVLKGMQQLKSCSFVLKHRITVVYQQHGKSDLASGSSEKHVHCWGHHDIPHCERELVKDLACLIKHDKIDFVIHSVVYVYAHLVVNLIL